MLSRDVPQEVHSLKITSSSRKASWFQINLETINIYRMTISSKNTDNNILSCIII